MLSSWGQRGKGLLMASSRTWISSARLSCDRTTSLCFLCLFAAECCHCKFGPLVKAYPSPHLGCIPGDLRWSIRCPWLLIFESWCFGWILAPLAGQLWHPAFLVLIEPRASPGHAMACERSSSRSPRRRLAICSGTVVSTASLSCFRVD